MSSVATHFQSVDEYLDSFPAETKKILQTLRSTIKAELPQAKEVITYNIPTYKLDGKIIIYFAGWKKHVSLYPFSEQMAKTFPETANYQTSGKGTIQFPLSNPLPLDLIRKITAFSLKESRK